MAKGSKGSIIGLVGGVLIGAAVLLFVVSLILTYLKEAAGSGEDAAARADWNTTNSTIDTIQTMMTVSAILLSVMGIVIVGSQIIGYIGGGFGA